MVSFPWYHLFCKDNQNTLLKTQLTTLQPLIIPRCLFPFDSLTGLIKELKTNLDKTLQDLRRDKPQTIFLHSSPVYLKTFQTKIITVLVAGTITVLKDHGISPFDKIGLGSGNFISPER